MREEGIVDEPFKEFGGDGEKRYWPVISDCCKVPCLENWECFHSSGRQLVASEQLKMLGKGFAMAKAHSLSNRLVMLSEPQATLGLNRQIVWTIRKATPTRLHVSRISQSKF